MKNMIKNLGKELNKKEKLIEFVGECDKIWITDEYIGLESEGIKMVRMVLCNWNHVEQDLKDAIINKLIDQYIPDMSIDSLHRFQNIIKEKIREYYK